MKLDLIYVTYNSSKWIDNCFASVMRSDYPLKDIFVYVVDNASSDDTIRILKGTADKYRDALGGFEIICSEKNLGFGNGNNLAFSKGNSPIACFFNVDTELCTDTLPNLVRNIENSADEVALWELRQFPYEHPKYYDPLTGETTWSSGAAFAIRREIYQKLGGFDKKIFMYAEDVDLSWRLRSFGYKLKYVPEAVIYHYSYASANEVKPNQYIYSLINNLMLRYRFGSFRCRIDGHLRIWKQIAGNRPFEHARKMLLKAYIKSFKNMGYFRRKGKVGSDSSFKPTFLGYDYAMIRDGAFHVNRRPKQYPLVSVIVRTCGRPDVLRETLISLRNQTYPNLEIVIYEDGAGKSEEMIRSEFADLNILYQASGINAGRSVAGNRAMALAHGKYLNFLDDDDIMFADHVETLVAALEGRQEQAAYAFAFETPMIVKSRQPYKYEVVDYLGIHKQTFDRITLCHHNYIPIQCIMFEKALFEQHGGLDESLDYLEDWDLWVRYSIYTDFICVPKTTSIYRTPADHKVNEARQKELDDALVVVREKHKSYMTKVSAYDIAQMYEHIH